MPRLSQSDQPLLPTSSTQPDNPNVEENPPTAPLANMGISHSTARIIGPLSFLFDFACQQYGMLSKPNMQDIHDANPCSFSPQPYFIGGFFAPQQVLQLFWLRELFRPDAEIHPNTLRYVPWYALGNSCIAIWMMFWNNDNLKGSNVLVMINTLTQLYYMISLRDKSPSTYQSKLTNAVNITFAGVGVLDFFHNLTAAYFPRMAPSALVQLFTVLGAPLTALFSPLLFGSCIAYDLAGVAVGQHQLAQKALGGATLGLGGGGGGESWAKMLGGVGLAVAGIVGARAYGGSQWL